MYESINGILPIPSIVKNYFICLKQRRSEGGGCEPLRGCEPHQASLAMGGERAKLVQQRYAFKIVYQFMLAYVLVLVRLCKRKLTGQTVHVCFFCI